jgi:hypothetical protein
MLRLALLFGCAAGARTAALEPRSVAESLDRWMVSRGALLGGEVRTPPGRPRGVYATRDYADDETMGFLPFAVSVPVGRAGEYAVSKLAKLVYDPASHYFVNGSYAPFWATQPPLSEMLCVDTMGEEEAAALELPELAEHIRLTRLSHREQYENLQARLSPLLRTLFTAHSLTRPTPRAG